MPRLRRHAAYLVFVALLTAKQASLVWQLGVSAGPWFWLVVPAAVVAISLWARRFEGRAQLALLAAVDAFVTLLVLADRLHFRAFGDVASVAALRYASQL